MSFLKSISKKIRYFFEDIRDDWKDFLESGPKSWFKAISSDLKESRESLLDLKDRATAKTSEEERRIMAEQRKKRRAERLYDFREGLYVILTFPWHALKAFGKAFRDFREKGFRDGVADLWSGYVAWVERLLGICSMVWQRYLGLHLWLRALVGTTTVTVFIVGCASPWLIEEMRDRRAQEMLAEARSGQDTDDVVDAYRKSRAAALMRPDDPEALELVLELADDVGTPEAIWWSERVSSIQGEDADSMNRVIETALRHRRVEKAERSFASMKSRHPDHERLAEIEVELLVARRKNSEAMRMALGALGSGADSPLLHTTVVGLGVRSSSADVRQQTFNHLLQNLYRNDEVGLALARLVFSRGIRLPDGDDDLIDYNQLISFIGSHEQANAVDRAASYSLAMRMGSIARETAEENILNQFDLEDRDELLSVVRGLGTLDLYESYERIIPAELIAEDPEFAMARIEGLIFQEEPDLDLAEAFLKGTSTETIARISSSKQAFWSAVIADLRGDSEAMLQGIATALEHSSSLEWGYFMANVPRVSDSEELLFFYAELFERSGRNPFIATRYLSLAYSHAEEEELSRLVRVLPLGLVEHEPQALSLLIYLKLLYDQESLDGCRYHAEKLVAGSPNDIGYLIGLAHVYALSDQRESARRLIAFWNPKGKLDSMPPYLQLSYLAVTLEDLGVVNNEDFRMPRERQLLDQFINGRLEESERSG